MADGVVGEAGAAVSSKEVVSDEELQSSEELPVELSSEPLRLVVCLNLWLACLVFRPPTTAVPPSSATHHHRLSARFFLLPSTHGHSYTQRIWPDCRDCCACQVCSGECDNLCLLR
jgi:hypothetical protein